MVDLDDDGHSDIVVTEFGPDGGGGPYEILSRDGGYALPVQLQTPSRACAGSVVAEFTGDHWRDVVAVCERTVLLYQGGAGGYFNAGRIVGTVGSQPQSAIVLGQLGGSSALDFATVEPSGTVSVGINDGLGSFAISPLVIGGDARATNLAVSDLNQDGFNDLLVSTSKNSVAIFYGSLTGLLSVPNFVATGGGGDMVAAADFNADQWPDFAVPMNENDAGSVVSVLLNDHDGGFVLTTPTVPSSPRSVAAGDFNRDGKPDLAVGIECATCNAYGFLMGNGQGEFVTTTIMGLGAGNLVSGDLNGDSARDLIFLKPSSLVVLLSTANNCPLAP